MIPSQGNQQKRVLGLGSATSTVVCNMIGAGIFMTTGLFARIWEVMLASWLSGDYPGYWHSAVHFVPLSWQAFGLKQEAIMFSSETSSVDPPDL
ncbi:MAG: hypothetical protein Ct9H300mP7_2210 [Verrucomicrobiota bacterium]|nr:MAG: hypothetical protein Ct9H300mP7_2210 [Verrucomicrobiota bacterium]